MSSNKLNPTEQFFYESWFLSSNCGIKSYEYTPTTRDKWDELLKELRVVGNQIRGMKCYKRVFYKVPFKWVAKQEYEKEL